jgi:CRISPR-associated protein Csb3
MSTITITGSYHTLLTHCALWGTASILANDLGSSRVRAGWIDPDHPEVLVNPQAVIDIDGASPEEAATIIRDLALMVSSSQHWAAQARWTDKKGQHTVSLLTSRTGLPETKELTGQSAAWWQTVQDQRSAEVAELSALEQDMVRGLGTRSWWLSEAKGIRPDLGASPWEMKTRNRGEEFLAHRFLPLAHEIAGWEPDTILTGLSGQTCNDVLGGNKPDSRTATGLAQPGPCDNALAWCALWALTAMQPVHQTQRLAPGGRRLAAPEPSPYTGRVQGKYMTTKTETLVVAVPNGLVSPAAWGRIQRSAPLTRALKRIDTDPIAAEEARARLRTQRLLAAVSFPISRSDNPSAPERRALHGTEILI